MSKLASNQLSPAKGSVEIVLLDGGSFTTTDDTKIHANGHHDPYFLYDWCFYVHHKDANQRILWDLGISDAREDYTPFVLNYHFPSCNPVGPRRNVVDQLKDLGVRAEDINVVIFSHAHWDHCRPAKKDFPSAKILFGPGTKTHCSPGHIQGGEIMPLVQWDSRFFGNSQDQTESFEELGGPWIRWGPFEQALDYFEDGSFWIIQAPGHIRGNLAACARLASGEHVVLASDCCHSADILYGRKDIAVVPLPDGSSFCLHEDLASAKDTIQRLRDGVEQYGMHVAMTHDAEWIKKQKDPVLMSILHPQFNQEFIAKIQAGQRP